jgi:hypothetical protein
MDKNVNIKNILVLGNAPLLNIESQNFDLIYYFSNNSRLLNDLSYSNAIGIIQDFTINYKYGDKNLYKHRKTKLEEFKRNFKDTHSTLIIGRKNSIKLSNFISEYNVSQYINHRQVIKEVIFFLPINILFFSLGFKGLVNYLLLLLGIKSKIPSIYRPSSGYYLILKVLREFPRSNIQLKGFSSPYENYITIEESLISIRPHKKFDTIIYNILITKPLISFL